MWEFLTCIHIGSTTPSPLAICVMVGLSVTSAWLGVGGESRKLTSALWALKMSLRLIDNFCLDTDWQSGYGGFHQRQTASLVRSCELLSPSGQHEVVSKGVDPPDFVYKPVAGRFPCGVKVIEDGVKSRSR